MSESSKTEQSFFHQSSPPKHTHTPGMPVEYDNYESVEVQPEEVPTVYYNDVILHKICTVRTPLDNTVSCKYTSYSLADTKH